LDYDASASASSFYTYVRNDPTNMTDPRGTDALWIVDQNTGQTTLVIPVDITGSGATTGNVTSIINRVNSIDTGASSVKIQTIATDKPINGILNRMDFSPGYNKTMCGDPRECVNKLGGDVAHINSANPDSIDAAAHDIFHFPGIEDQYQEGPRDAQGNRTSTPKPGYNNTNIMTSRSGTKLNPAQISEGQTNKTTKHCIIQTGSRIPTCN